jgi:hypothetical protein
MTVGQLTRRFLAFFVLKNGGHHKERAPHRDLGHARLEQTVVYLHLSQRHLKATANPLDAMTVLRPDEIK